ncbi:hypothetical protein THIOM_004145 [Candidatus Thiomargarita nelsonii]|uniref:Uncharacterized protein n=1 Tax=Candidatus Thiomargarita nelsonii TaxID=1003181 RepID=A0A176RWR6_9GAMM|nr:hypothetical protein THIOM_004145 [Candidatus Thiomargarita nelsonii]
MHNHRTIGCVCRLHDGMDLFHIVDVKCRQSITIFCGMIEQLTHGNKHKILLNINK